MSYREVVTAVARVLFTRRMLGGLALAVAFAVACVLLGRWQWGRYEDKQVKATAVTTHYAAAPVPYGTVAGRLPLDEDGQWLRVTTTGQYSPGEQLLVRQRVEDGVPGMEVLVPYAADGVPGARLLVDRGWVPNGDSAAQLPSVPATPSGKVQVQGWLRVAEPSLGKSLPTGQLASISVADAQQQVGGPLADGYLVLESETTAQGTAPARPAALDAPDTDLGPHQAYAFQWWLTSVFGFVFVGYRVRETLRAQRGEEAAAGLVPVGGAAGGAAAAGSGEPGDLVLASAAGTPTATSVGVQPKGPKAPKPPKPKKVRIWDEEDG